MLLRPPNVRQKRSNNLLGDIIVSSTTVPPQKVLGDLQCLECFLIVDGTQTTAVSINRCLCCQYFQVILLLGGIHFPRQYWQLEIRIALFHLPTVKIKKERQKVP
jgi:hypothetical protein